MLTPGRLANFLATNSSYLLSVLTGRPFVWGQPCSMTIEPAAICNLSCPHCPAGTKKVDRRNKTIDPELFRHIIDQAAPGTGYLMLYFQGEPLLHRDFIDLVSYAGKKRMYTVTATNGQLITNEVAQRLIDSGLNELIVSVDGTDQETYSLYRRGGSFDQLVEGIRNLVKYKTERHRYYPRIILQFIVFRHNQHQIKEIKKLARVLGADRVRIKSAFLYPVPGAGDLLPGIKKYRRYHVAEDGSLILRRKMKNRCRRIWHTAVVTSDGDLVPCCFDKETSMKIGSLKKKPLKELWKNSEFMSFRRRILQERKSSDICRNCTEGLGRIIFK